MPPTTSYKRGDVILAPFPFSDQTSIKQRPALVISVEDFQEQGPDLLIMAVTSQVRGPLKLGEFLIRDWQAAEQFLTRWQAVETDLQNASTP